MDFFKVLKNLLGHEPEVIFSDPFELMERHRLWEKLREARRRALPYGLQLLYAIKQNLEDPIALSPRGDFLTSGAKDATIRLWNPKIGREVGRLRAHSNLVSSVAWSPNSLLVSGANDTTIRLWDVHTAREIRTLMGHTRNVTSVAWSPDGHWLASGGEDKTVRIWDTRNGTELHTLVGHRRRVRSVAWSTDGELVASAGDGGFMHLWNSRSGSAQRVIEAHSGPGGLRSIAWSPTERRLLASGGDDATVRLWDAETGRQVRRLEGHTNSVVGVAFSPDGRLLVSQSVHDGAEVCFWRTDTWELVATLPINPFRSHYPLDFQSNAPVLLTGGDAEDEVRIWKMDGDALMHGTQPTMQYSNAKVVLMGDSGVGKTGLFTVLSGEPFRATESTHGRHVHILESQEVSINERGQQDPAGLLRERREILLWDLAGQPAYRIIHQLHLNEVTVALIVFDGRNESDPFAGVGHWDRALRQAQSTMGQAPMPLKKYLVAARVDRGGIGVSKERIDQFVQEMGFHGYIETSAKEGLNIDALKGMIKGAIAWEALPRVTSNVLFENIKSFLLQRKEGGQILSIKYDLYNAFLSAQKVGPDSEELRAQFGRCIALVEARDLIRHLGIGNFLLLQPELLDAYASALVNSVRDEPDGLGSILERKVKDCQFRMPSDERIEDRDQEVILLLAVIQDLLRHELALREETVEGTYLVFPSQCTRVNYELPDPEGKALVFDFEGSIQNIYVTLAVRLASSELFAKKELWNDAITYTARVGGICGMFLQQIGDGRGRLTLFFDQQATEETRFHFENYIENHLQRRAIPGSIHRSRFFTCPEPSCREPVSASIVQKRRARGLNWLICSNCGTRVELADRAERLTGSPLSLVLEMDNTADSRRVLSVLKSTRNEERDIAAHQGRKLESFDVYLCYGEADRPLVKQVAGQLLEMNIVPWLDEWEVSSGENRHQELETHLPAIGAAVVFVGDGLPPWEDKTQDEYLRAFAHKRVVVPVILPECKKPPILPGYIKKDWVDMRIPEPDPIGHLIQSIRTR